jgi:hypothetical protein
MKNLILSFAVLTSVLAVSCKKENTVKPQNASASKTVEVEYRITNESGSVEINYLKPNSEGKFEMENEKVNRTYYSINFEAKKGNTFMVEAFNTLPARKTVHVQIFINGELFKEAFSYDPSQKAIAEGNY